MSSQVPTLTRRAQGVHYQDVGLRMRFGIGRDVRRSTRTEEKTARKGPVALGTPGSKLRLTGVEINDALR